MKVIKEFSKNELKSEIQFIDSIDGTYNPKRMTVGTVDGNVYAFYLVRYHNYEGIWVVSRYALYEKKDLAISNATVKFEEIDPKQAEQTVQDWFRTQTSKKQRSQDYLLVNDKIYILLTAKEGESVELLDVSGTEERIIVSHANSSVDSEKRNGEKPFVLLYVKSPITEIKFNEYSKVQSVHSNLYTP